MLTEDDVKKMIFKVCKAVGVDPAVAMAISEIESQHGMYRQSPTGARGVFQMTSIAMKDLLIEMAEPDRQALGICCGVAFIRLLMTRHEDELTAISKYCDPDDREWYPEKVLRLAEKYRREIIEKDCYR